MKTPPRPLMWLLENLCPKSRPDLSGDLLELYNERRAINTAWRANVGLLFDALSVVPLRLVVKEESHSKSPFMMITNLKLAQRNLRKNRLYTMINVLGLCVSLTACILITLFVRDELSYDQHFRNKEMIMRIGAKYGEAGKENVVMSPVTTWMLQPLMEGRVAGIESSVRVDFNELMVETQGKEFLEGGVMYADSTFFDIFSLPLIAGNRETVLDDPTGVVIDRATASKFFGEGDAMGKVISIYEKPFHVTGIMENVPVNTHFQASIIFPMAGVQETYPEWVRSNVSGRSVYTYIRIGNEFNEATFPEHVRKAIAELWPHNSPEFYVQSIASIHLGPKYPGEVDPSGSKIDVYIFSATALIILILACVNYINLSIAAALPRSRETGIKKVLGSTRGMLVSQFQTESFVVLTISLILALVLAWVLMPFFNQLSAKNLSFRMITDPFMVGLVGGTFLAIGLLAGSLPAWSLLRSSAVGLLTNKISFKGTKSYLSNGLIVFQFAIAAALVACTLIVTDQIRFIRNRDLGFKPDQLVMVPLQISEISARFETLKHELLNAPGVVSVSGSTDKITNRVGGWRPYEPEGREDLTIPTVSVAHDFFETIGAGMAGGRSFSRSFPADFNKSYIINETAAELLGFTDAVGKQLKGAAFNGRSWYPMEAQIIGVVKDFHFASLHNKIEPVVFSLSSEHTVPMSWMEVRIDASDATSTIGGMEKVWKKLAPERSFQFEFVDDALQNHYVAEQKFLRVFIFFSSLAIVLGALGLFGLTAFMTKRRTKEIGIRKVVGASMTRLIGILSKDFLLLVVLANLIGWPAAWYFMDQWLDNFAVQTTISLWVFVLTGVAAVAIAFLAILYHAVKVSKANPVEALRSE